MPEAGQSLSHYRLIEKIGQGGMGEVWKASDGRLDREVALKLLPEIVTQDATRLDRFTREAKLLASLNHPGIATIHDVDEHEGVRFIVMELVPGDDLSQALERGPLPVTEALETALQIARAVEVAHGQGVVHRDLKPANVKRAADGQIKVLDFGLAKAMAPDPSSGEPSVSMSPTVTSAGTVAGVILGTAAYMSPEQARGRKIDKRTDVWSFGVLLYELLTADNPFRGDTVADSVGAIMHRDPDLDALPPATPTAVRRLLKRCLTRERARRLHDIADARIELEEAIANPVVEPDRSTAGAGPGARPSKLPWIALAVLVPVVALLGWLLGSARESEVPQPSRRFELAPEAEVDSVVLSPDGTRVAYVVEDRLLIRSLDTLEPREAGIDIGSQPTIFWSPDGRSIGVFKGPNQILRFDLDGGAPIVLTDSAEFAENATWADDGHIYFAQFQGGISRIPESGGAPEPVFEALPGMFDYHGLAVLPGGKAALTVPHTQEEEALSIYLERPGGQREVLFTSDSMLTNLRYSPTGHIFYHRAESPRGLWALPFSAGETRVTGEPFLVVPDLTQASFSASGDMVYTQAALHSGKQKQSIVWLDAGGEEVERLDMALYGAFSPVVSPDASKVAFYANGIGRPSTDRVSAWVVDLERQTSTRLTTDRFITTPLLWSADGTRVAYIESTPNPDGTKNVFSARADGTGGRELLFKADIQFFTALNRDWSMAAYMNGTLSGENGMGLEFLRVDDPSAVATFVDGPDHEIAPNIHPDGNWIVYLAGQIPDLEAIVRPFPEGDGQWKISRGARAGLSSWAQDGKSLYYTTEDDDDAVKVFQVSFDGSGPTPVFGTPRLLFTSPKSSIMPTPDGRFVYVEDEKPAEGEEQLDMTGIVLVENWASRFEK